MFEWLINLPVWLQTPLMVAVVLLIAAIGAVAVSSFGACGIAMIIGTVNGMTMRMMNTTSMKNTVMMTITMNGRNARRCWVFPWPCLPASGSMPGPGHRRPPGCG